MEKLSQIAAAIGALMRFHGKFIATFCLEFFIQLTRANLWRSSMDVVVACLRANTMKIRELFSWIQLKV